MTEGEVSDLLASFDTRLLEALSRNAGLMTYSSYYYYRRGSLPLLAEEFLSHKSSSITYISLAFDTHDAKFLDTGANNLSFS